MECESLTGQALRPPPLPRRARWVSDHELSSRARRVATLAASSQRNSQACSEQ